MFPVNNRQPSHRRGLSLVEVMIAMVMTLIVLGAMMAAFAYGSAEMQKGRASIELNNRLINAEEQLRRDLDRITVAFKPFHQLQGFPSGYAEIVEGAQTDLDFDGDGAPDGSVFGDRDDFIAFTIRSDGRPFRGRLGNNVIESHLAEVIWFAVDDPATADGDERVLVRRQMLILPGANVAGADIKVDDISVRQEGGMLVANSLSDLALRGNRFAHASGGTPPGSTLARANLANLFEPTHVISSNVAAFDVQVFDPIVDAYVDLGSGAGFFGTVSAGYTESVYDTGTSRYNRDNFNGTGTNPASNGVDDGGAIGIVDDIGEQIARPPFNAPIRGLKFTMRVFEPASKQVRQLSVQKSFVPES